LTNIEGRQAESEGNEEEDKGGKGRTGEEKLCGLLLFVCLLLFLLLFLAIIAIEKLGKIER